MNQPIVLDNTVLTNFALVKRPDLVLRLWAAMACTTSAAQSEYQAGVATGILPGDIWADLSVLTLTEDETTFAASLSSRLGAGERSCIAVAVYRQGLLVSDDVDARKAAQKHAVPTTGTVGILALCVQRSLLSRDQANALLIQMMAAGYRSPIVNLDALLD